MASANEDVYAARRDFDKLKLSPDRTSDVSDAKDCAKVFEPHLWGFETRELYKIALNFYKGETLSLLVPPLRPGL